MYPYSSKGVGRLRGATLPTVLQKSIAVSNLALPPTNLQNGNAQPGDGTTSEDSAQESRFCGAGSLGERKRVEDRVKQGQAQGERGRRERGE